ncbi:serine hydrolase FSH [Aspergillus granulosus]|uniref:Serine hydrolase FSH n=1 Tax=Aspergillus granulosus TaxID=176169 RepID=A0ABR4GUG4_9EURO
MKVLCLHGRGTSGAIFKSQTSSIRARLTDLNLDFDFLDGQYPCAPAPGIDLFYPPPYYSYIKDPPPPNGTTPASSYTIESIKSTHAWLSAILAERGPYDLVLTFSQGAALAASLLLMHEVNQAQFAALDRVVSNSSSDSDSRPAPPEPPFKSAIFICGGAPIPVLEYIGFHIPHVTKARDLASRAALSSAADSASILALGSSRWTGLSPSFSTAFSTSPLDTQCLPSGFTYNKEEEIRREMCGPVQIGIPTVHIYGERDPRYVAGIQLSEVCIKARRKVYNHGGGHEIPRFEAVSGAIADLVRWAVRAARAQD